MLDSLVIRRRYPFLRVLYYNDFMVYYAEPDPGGILML